MDICFHKSLAHCNFMTYTWRWNPHWHFATVWVSFVFSQCLWMTQPNSESQPDGLRETEGGRQKDLVYLFLGACGGVQQFLQLSVHGALQLLPHHFLELSHPSFGHSFTQTWTGEKVEDGGQGFTLLRHILILTYPGLLKRFLPPSLLFFFFKLKPSVLACSTTD